MKVQQAPSPVQSALALPEIVASVTAHSTNGGTVNDSTPSTASVRAVFAIELKRFWRNQSRMRGIAPSTLPGARSSEPAPGRGASDGIDACAPRAGLPTSMVGARGGRLGPRWRLRPASSPLYQGDAAVVPVHKRGGEQTDDEEGRHDDPHRLDLLGRLLHHRTAEYLHDFRIADGRAE